MAAGPGSTAPRPAAVTLHAAAKKASSCAGHANSGWNVLLVVMEENAEGIFSYSAHVLRARLAIGNDEGKLI